MRSWPDGFVQTCVTSPPYFGLRDYGVDGQIGLEPRPEEYIAKLVAVFREVKRVLRDDGTLWLNLGDSYSSQRWSAGAGQPMNGGRDTHRSLNPERDTGLPPKNLIGIPWRVAFALQADGWILRQDIIWAKGSCMPESVTDRCTKSHEYLFLLAKSQDYFYDHDAIKEKSVCFDTDPMAGMGNIRYEDGKRNGEDGNGQSAFATVGEKRNKRSVWTVNPRPFAEAHFATFPPDLIAPCILAGAPAGGVVLDPFMGAGTTALVAATYGRRFIGCELNPEYKVIAEKRIANEMAQEKML